MRLSLNILLIKLLKLSLGIPISCILILPYLVLLKIFRWVGNRYIITIGPYIKGAKVPISRDLFTLIIKILRYIILGFNKTFKYLLP